MWGYKNLVDAVFSNGGSLLSEDGTRGPDQFREWVEVWESFRQWIHDDGIMKIHSGGQGWESGTIPLTMYCRIKQAVIPVPPETRQTLISVL